MFVVLVLRCVDVRLFVLCLAVCLLLCVFYLCMLLFVVRVVCDWRFVSDVVHSPLLCLIWFVVCSLFAFGGLCLLSLCGCACGVVCVA